MSNEIVALLQIGHHRLNEARGQGLQEIATLRHGSCCGVEVAQPSGYSNSLQASEVEQSDRTHEFECGGRHPSTNWRTNLSHRDLDRRRTIEGRLAFCIHAAGLADPGRRRPEEACGVAERLEKLLFELEDSRAEERRQLSARASCDDNGFTVFSVIRIDVTEHCLEYPHRRRIHVAGLLLKALVHLVPSVADGLTEIGAQAEPGRVCFVIDRMLVFHAVSVEPQEIQVFDQVVDRLAANNVQILECLLKRRSSRIAFVDNDSIVQMRGLEVRVQNAVTFVRNVEEPGTGSIHPAVITYPLLRFERLAKVRLFEAIKADVAHVSIVSQAPQAEHPYQAKITANCRVGQPIQQRRQVLDAAGNQVHDFGHDDATMIHESHYWKDDLLKAAASLEQRVTQHRWRDATFANVEKKVMLGFYAIRKLIEAHKVDDQTARQNVAVVVYPSTGKLVTRSNWHRWWELYDLEDPRKTKIRLVPLCHQFVHSYVFSCAFDESRALESVLVSSDRERNRMLFSVSIDELIRVFRAVGKNYPNYYHSEFNDSTGDYDVVIRTQKRGAIYVKD